MISSFLLWGLAFIFSLTAHEAAHAIVAKLKGDDTAYQGGQATLNPLPHIQRSPFGMVIVPTIMFFWAGYMIGWASAPIDPYWAQRHPKRSALVALAGPAANLTIALTAALAFRLLVVFGAIVLTDNGYATNSQEIQVIVRLIYILFQLNIILFVFNLLPFYPLDGSEGILLFFPEEKAPAVRAFFQQMGMFGLLIGWAIAYMILGPIMEFAFNLLFF